MKRHFVTFFSPGTFFAEQSEFPIDSWDVEEAKEMSKSVKERHGAAPYGFCFSTRERGPDDLDSQVTESSNMYYINCKVETLAELIVRNDPREAILRSNMEGNGWDKIVTTTKGFRWTQPLKEGDVVLE